MEDTGTSFVEALPLLKTVTFSFHDVEGRTMAGVDVAFDCGCMAHTFCEYEMMNEAFNELCEHIKSHHSLKKEH